MSKIKEFFLKIKYRKYNATKLKKVKWTIKSFLEEKKILHLCYVTKIELNFLKNKVTIHLRQPGIIIGKAGIVIKELEEYLNKTQNIKKVSLKEDHVF